MADRFDDIPGLQLYYSAAESALTKTGNKVDTCESVYGSDTLTLSAVGLDVTHGVNTIGAGNLAVFTTARASWAALYGRLDANWAVGPITVATVYQTSNTTDNQYPFEIDNDNSINVFGLSVGPNIATLANNSTKTSGVASVSGTPEIIINQWDAGATNAVRTYKNGSLIDTDTQSETTRPYRDINICSRVNSDSVDGHVAIVAIYLGYLNDSQITELNTLCQYWLDNGEAPNVGPPTTVTFGPVTTNDDPSVTTWNWEASADGGTNWDEAENVLSDVSGEATTSLVVKSAILAENGTQVRCRAISAKEPAGVVSATATLTVQAAS